MAVPFQIANCPIVDSVIELRFISGIYSNAVFGVLYNLLKSDFGHVENLPIMQLPEQLRESDPALKNKPNYRLLSEDNYSLQIGPNVIVFGAPVPYPGWNTVSKRFFGVCDMIKNAGIVNEITRVGVRYINFFELDIFNHIDVELNINKNVISSTNTLIRTELEKNSFKNTVQIGNNVRHQFTEGIKTGSIVDIDTFKTLEQTTLGTDFFHLVEIAHDTEKDIFFSLLKKEFLESLKPTYS